MMKAYNATQANPNTIDKQTAFFESFIFFKNVRIELGRALFAMNSWDQSRMVKTLKLYTLTNTMKLLDPSNDDGMIRNVMTKIVMVNR